MSICVYIYLSLSLPRILDLFLHLSDPFCTMTHTSALQHPMFGLLHDDANLATGITADSLNR